MFRILRLYSFCIAFAVASLFVLEISAVNGQDRRLGIVNGSAAYLPKPIYSSQAELLCADGLVEIEILIGRNGQVLTAKAISGDPLLTEASVIAARKAQFRSHNIRIRGILSYNFDSFSKCLKRVGLVNQKALSIPKPRLGDIIHPSHIRITEDDSIYVEVVIDQDGNVLRALATNGHPLLRAPFERSALGAKFPRVLFGPIRVKATLVYTIKPDGTIDY
ncbi:MAG: hypothetical protein ACRD6X_02045 [Pyrinomonadaceae bacterium]